MNGYVAIFPNGEYKFAQNISGINNEMTAVCFASKNFAFNFYGEEYSEYQFVDINGNPAPFNHMGYSLYRIEPVRKWGPPDSLEHYLDFRTPSGISKRAEVICAGELFFKDMFCLIDKLAENGVAYLDVVNLKRKVSKLNDSLESLKMLQNATLSALRTAITPIDTSETPPRFCNYAKSLRKAIITKNIKTMSRAFQECPNLIEVYCEAPIPPEINDGTFKGISEGAILFVPRESVELYRNSSVWRDFFKIIVSLE